MTEGKEEKSSVATSSTWKSFKPTVTTATSQKDLKEKEKIPLTKTPKYISINKSETMFKPSVVVGKI